MQGLTSAGDRSRAIPLLPQFAATLIRAGRTAEAISQLDQYVELQRIQPTPPSPADIKRLRSAIDSLMNSGKVSASLLSSLTAISDTGRVDAGGSSQDDSELANDHMLLQGKWRCDFWKNGKLTERMRVEFAGNDNKTEWVDANEQVIRGRSGHFAVSRSGGVKVLTTYLDSSAEVGGTFIYHLAEDELRIVSGMLANQPSLPEVELRVFHRIKVAR